MISLDWTIIRDEPDATARWMLELVDAGDHRFATIEIPRSISDDELDEVEAAFIRAYDLAKDRRPNLCVKIEGTSLRLIQHHPNAQLIMILHEHQWVGGHCVNGCSDTRPSRDS
jgi:hypothetical protein